MRATFDLKHQKQHTEDDNDDDNDEDVDDDDEDDDEKRKDIFACLPAWDCLL
uniref:GK20409 n=1 Tax=Drosophila willistoni TaxID=7260 RepID=B4N507_DROWI